MHRTDLDDNIRADLFGLEGEQLKRHSASFLPGVKTSDKLMTYPVYRWLIENSQLYRAVRENVAGQIKTLLVRFRKGPSDDEEEVIAGSPDFDAYKRRLNLALVQEIERVSGDARLVMLEVPNCLDRLHYSSTHPLDEANNPYVATGQYVTFINELTKAARPDLKLFYEKGHGHLTSAGVEIALAKVLPSILASPQLQPYSVNQAQ